MLFRGMCVGGPRNGDFVESEDGPIYRVPVVEQPSKLRGWGRNGPWKVGRASLTTVEYHSVPTGAENAHYVPGRWQFMEPR